MTREEAIKELLRQREKILDKMSYYAKEKDLLNACTACLQSGDNLVQALMQTEEVNTYNEALDRVVNELLKLDNP